VAPGTGVALVVERGLDELVLDAIGEGGDPGRLLTHAEHNVTERGALTPTAFASLSKLEVGGALTATQAKTVLAELIESGGDPEAIAKAKGFEAMDDSALESLIDQLIADNPDAFEKLKAGDKKVVGFFTGAVMKATQGKANGGAVNKILQQRANA